MRDNCKSPPRGWGGGHAGSQPRPPVVALGHLHGAHALLLGIRAGQRGLAGGVAGVVQQRVDLVHEERVELLGDVLLVCEGEGALEGDPFLW
jgi:hypothetical protein